MKLLHALIAGGISALSFTNSHAFDFGTKPSTPPMPTSVSVPSTSTSGNYSINWTTSASGMVAHMVYEKKNQGSYIKIGQTGSKSLSVSGKSPATYQYGVKSCSTDFNTGTQYCSGMKYSNTITVFNAEPTPISDNINDGTQPSANTNILPIQGQAGVSGGSASYSLPIELPPGRAGMQPSLSLNYSSRGGNGVVGVGWSLSTGGSSIHRCSKTAAQDEYSRSVRLTNDDAICLDGKRLMAVSGSYGQSGTYYRTELDSFALVYQAGSLSSFSTDFIVKTKDGRTWTYAQTVNTGAGVPVSWLLTQVTDPSNNSIHYNYETFGTGETLVKSIKYTGTGTSQGNREVRMIYQARTDDGVSYLAGFPTQRTQRLEKIQTLVSNSLKRQYKLNYYTDAQSVTTARSQLKSIEKCDASGTCLPPLNITTNMPALSWSQTTDTAMGLPQLAEGDYIRYIDLDGNGIQEAIYHQRHSVTSGVFDFTLKLYKLANESGQYTYVKNLNHNIFVGAMQGDINGDGINDFSARQSNNRVVYYQFDHNFNVTLNTTSFYLNSSYNTLPVATGNNIAMQEAGAQLADLNGDGYQDIFIARSQKIGGKYYAGVYLNKANGNVDFTGPYQLTTLQHHTGGLSTEVESASLMDVDGDGLQDLLLNYNNKTFAAHSTISSRVEVGFMNRSGSTLSITRRTASQLGLPTELSSNQFTWADVNGDGLSDFVRATTSGWKVRINKGNKTFASETSLGTNTGIHTYTTYHGQFFAKSVTQARFGGLHAVDVDSDGVDELVVATGSSDKVCVNVIGMDDTNRLEMAVEVCDDDIHKGRFTNTEQSSGYVYDSLSEYDIRRFNWSVIDFKTVGNNVTKRDVYTDMFTAPLTSQSLLNGKQSHALMAKDFNNDGYVDFTHQSFKRRFTPAGNGTVIHFGGLVLERGGITASFKTGGPSSDEVIVEKSSLSHSTKLADTVTKISHNLGHQVSWDYAPISRPGLIDGRKLYTVPNDRSQWYTNQGDNNKEHFYFTSSMPVVTSFYQNNGVGGLNQSRYFYKEAIYNRKGRGFQGFHQIITEDEQANTRAVTDFHQIFPKAGQIDEIRTCVATTSNPVCASNQLSTTTVDSYAEIDTTGKGTYWVYPSKTTKKQYDRDRNASYNELLATTTTENFADQKVEDKEYGNISRTKTTFVTNSRATTRSDGNGSLYQKTQVSQTTTNFDYTYEANWWINKPYQITSTTYAVSGESGYPAPDSGTDDTETVTTKFGWSSADWDTTVRKPKKVTVDAADSNKDLTTTTAYNSYGQPTSVTQSTAGETSRTTTTTYRDSYYFPYTVTQSGIKTMEVLSVDLATGTPLHTKDINGISSTTSLDGFGRPLFSKTAGVPKVYTRIRSCGSSCGTSNTHAKYYIETTQYNAPTVREYKDSLGRTLETWTNSFAGGWIKQKIEFDGRGRKTFESVPTDSGNFNYGSRFYYNGTTSSHYGKGESDVMGRVTRRVTNTAQGGSLTVDYKYRGASTVITATSGTTNSMSRTYNALGQLIETEDAKGGKVKYTYDNQGNPIVMQHVDGSRITASYDALGHKQWVKDPDMGRKDFVYNGFGELKKETDARGKIIETQFDTLGRMNWRKMDGMTSTWSYGQGNLKGVLASESGQGMSRSFVYDNVGRIDKTTETIDGVNYVNQTFYNDAGKVKQVNYPQNSLKVAYTYKSNGYLETTKNKDTGFVYQQIKAMDAHGNWTQAYQNGSNVQTNREFDDASGQMISSVMTKYSNITLSEHTYDYGNFGNLSKQYAYAGSYTNVESFQFDNLHRLTQSNRNVNGSNLTPTYYHYDTNGNLRKKTDYSINSNSAYTYGNTSRSSMNAGPHAPWKVALANSGGTRYYRYDNSGNMTNEYHNSTSSNAVRTISYNSMNKPTMIRVNSTRKLNPFDTKTTSSNTVYFKYGPNGFRYKQYKSSTDYTLYLMGRNYEVIRKGSTTTTRIHIGDHTVINNGSVKFMHKDRLGSTAAIVTTTGTLLESHSFDPFGRPRDGGYRDKWTLALGKSVMDSDYTTKGYTSHEQLDDSQYTHMNGRLYDYNLGRFLSVDPFIQAPGNSQNLNPYSYVMNNPLAGTDPSGYLFFIPVLVKAVMWGTAAYGAYEAAEEAVEVIEKVSNDEVSVEDGVKAIAISAAEKVVLRRAEMLIPDKLEDKIKDKAKDLLSKDKSGGNGVKDTQSKNNTSSKDSTEIGSQKEVNQAETVEINLHYKNNGKYDKDEFNSQAADQGNGLESQTAGEIKGNLEDYSQNGRKSGNKAIKEYKEEHGGPETGQHTLHRADANIGGNPKDISGYGDGKINSSIGSQNKQNANTVSNAVQNVSPDCKITCNVFVDGVQIK